METITRHVSSCAQSARFHSLAQAIDAQQVLQTAVAIQQIPAPTFDEQRRAEYVRDRFAAAGLREVSIDALHNTVGRWPGADPARPALLVSAHTDTVFPADTDLTVREESGRLCGPGLGDNSLGVAALITLAEQFVAHNIHPLADIWFAANSREEGLGNLDGIRAVWNALGARLGAAIVIEGMALGRVYHAGIGVRRLHIVCHAPGGHSWLHFGQPSAVHGLIDLGARILALTPPREPRTTYNIGLIHGGHSVNSLACEAGLYLDLRSEDPAHLATLERAVRECIDSAGQAPLLTFSTTVVGDRPAGQVDPAHPLVQMAGAALELAGVSALLERGSTDANALLANGLPTITVGVSRGAHSHRQDEYIETAPVATGLWQLALLVLSAAEWEFRRGAAGE
ncbi:MAG: M20/M25/M40 family metallo-hydrolase [Anaerolineae bacterium]|nr:M20/M25/M40 family metallo-hydrolase [Anaerolineae bacterium]